VAVEGSRECRRLEVEQRIRRSRDLELTAVAAAGVHLPDMQRPSQTPVNPVAQRCRRFVKAWTGLHFAVQHGSGDVETVPALLKLTSESDILRQAGLVKS
jgi:hypothetical protein